MGPRRGLFPVLVAVVITVAGEGDCFAWTAEDQCNEAQDPADESFEHR